MIVQTYYSAHCPYTNSRQNIKIKYASVHVLGTPRTGYRKTAWSCPLSDECDYLSKHNGYCPLFLSAPDEPNL